MASLPCLDGSQQSGFLLGIKIVPFEMAVVPSICPTAVQRQLDIPLSDVGAAHLASLRQLTSLDLGGHPNLTAQGLGFLSGFTALRSLWVQLPVPLPPLPAC
jgi:hypothetical protein